MIGPRPREADPARLWRLGWLAAVGLTAGAAALTPGVTPTAVWLALGAGAAPALAALLVGRRGGDRVQSLMLVFWAVGGACAAILTGGVSGAMSAWCLAPAAAASTMSAPRRLAEGAALSLIGGAMAALGQLSGLTPAAPTGLLAFLLGLLAVATTGVGLAAGLMLTHRRAGQSAARHFSERRGLETLLDGLPHLAITVTPQGKVRAARGGAPAGIEIEVLLRDGLAAIGVREARLGLNAALGEARQNGAASVTFTPVQAPDRAVTLDLSRITPNLLIGVLRDSTAESAHAAALEQARNDAEGLAAGRARFLANMSHELRTPLNAIMGFSDIMRARMFGALSERYGEYAQLIHESGGHLLDLINDVLDMSKIEAERYELTRETFDARDPTTAAMRLLRVQADAAGVALRGVLPPAELPVEADRRALKQIVLNLVSNALKFTPRGGQVTVTLDGHDGIMELVVADTGVGISPEDLERLGRPYEQAGGADQRSRGTGLGLSLVRAFAQLHGGEMLIESRLGAGTTVSVRLPVLPGPPADVEDDVLDLTRLGPNVVAFHPGRGG
ncbi:MAG: two-component sensor histidine kinase [Caulobacter sp.]|nr:two-component sensor histidine kinase [Caulobacter sp.]